ncbi:DNA polymerase III subunit delta' [Streptococcus porcinus]|uniref:DNA polymerase III subunit delta n=2 Tax=Streptococcus porcinus TaxID=1340 RepID=A0A4V0H7R9_STRPO|nr:DNA polymerase III subunit delta' [Streptococcus porcinus]EGJ26471.1 DNA polymerase III, delta' subunit [Streptococcus porcinus str. Jelinkova 176]SQG44876.1 DNA polymerase III subunit delta' [Streptococcus porcinus]VTT45354.1 DNA polymerase III subunit delta' [Streptococcus porcinus]VTT46839.1 DNA polymerase III subunit delta' [Streptococcus porcinus]
MSIEELAPQAYRSFQTILAKERLNHAYLFSGDFANFEMALYLTKAIFCQDLKDKLPCGRCRSCQLITKNEFQDLTILEPTGQVIKTESIREMLKNFSRTGYEGEQQVFIIRDCEKMHVNAANALLKHIEEPQSASYIFLLTNDDNQVLPTIKSRTQIFRFPKNEDYLSRQAQKAGLLKNQADLMAKLAKSPDDLDKLIKDSKILEFITLSQKFTKNLLSNQEKAYLEVSRLATSALDKKEQDIVLKLITYHLANDYNQPKAIHYLDGLYLARQMWESNVSFQNSLEYMVLS